MLYMMDIYIYMADLPYDIYIYRSTCINVWFSMIFWSFAKPFEDGSYDQAAWGDWHDKGPSMR